MHRNQGILEFLESYDKKGSVRFHMPGHKGKNMEELSKLFPSLDITEIEGSDNLHFPEGVIKESERRASELYGSVETIFIVNGSTASIYSAITGAVNDEEKLMLQRDSHKAAHNALILGGIVPEYIYPEYDEELELNLGILNEEALREKLKDSEIKAVFLTYPNYYGICCPLERIAEIVHKYGRVLIVDEAHGSHFKFDDRLPKSAIDCGADIVIHSTHKSLLGLTQTSMLHICSDRINPEDIRRMSRIYQSTSPSYLLMASLDYTVKEMSVGGEGRIRLNKYMDALEEIIYGAETADSGFNILKREDILKRGCDFDITKIVFSVPGFSGKELEEKLRDSHNIELEMSDHIHGVALSTLMDSREDLLALKSALTDISEKAALKDEELNQARGPRLKSVKYPELVYRPRDVFYSDSEYIDIAEACGRISSDMVIPYPPGIPILSYGERVDAESADRIRYLSSIGISIQGLEDGKIKVLKG